MNALVRGWAVLALVSLVSSQARAQNGAIEVQSTPTHTIDESEATAAQGQGPAPGPLMAPALPAPSDTGASAPDMRPDTRIADAQALRAQIEHEGPSVQIAQRVMNAAGTFDRYMRQTAAITPAFTDGAGVGRAVMAGSSYEAGQLQEGAVAYAALTALQSPRFVQNLSDLGQDPSVRAQLTQALLADPNAALRLQGAREAGGLAVSVMGRLGGDLLTSGTAMKQAAYDIQHQAWSKEAAPAHEAQLTQVKAQSAIRTSLEPADTAGLIRGLVAVRKAGVDPNASTASPTPVVARGLALAALAVLGAAGEDKADQLTPLLSEASSAQCMKMAKLNLYQCLSVAGPHYEDMFCLGRHAMMETGQCVVAAAGWSSPTLNSVPVALASNTSALVPVALASEAGPERDSVLAGRAALGSSPQAEEAAPVSAAPVAVVASVPERAPMLAVSPWRPNGPMPQDQFVGGPYSGRAAPIGYRPVYADDGAAPAYGDDRRQPAVDDGYGPGGDR